MWRILLSPNCSWRRNSCPIWARFSRRAGSVRPAIRWFGRRILPSSKAKAPATCNSRPTGRAFSGAGRRSARPRRSPKAGRCRIPPGRFSIRSSACAAACVFRRGATARIAFWTMVAASREDVLDLADKHRDSMAFERATTLAWTQAQMQLRHLGISTDEAHLFQRLANHVLYSDPTLRPSADILERGARKVSTLWPQGISGDLPIVLVRIEEEDDLELVRQLLRAHEYWRLKQLAVDLVILNERAASYLQDLQTRARCAGADEPVDAKDRERRFARRGVRPARRSCIGGSSRPASGLRARGASWQARNAGRADQSRPRTQARQRAAGKARRCRRRRPKRPCRVPRWNSSTGLAALRMTDANISRFSKAIERTPAPWINVIANPAFGFQVSTDGSGFTWSINSQQNQLTPWSNDPVGDAPGEVIYVRDEDSGEVWTPTALPIREKTSPYSVRHGQGYSRFEHSSHGIALELLQFVPVDDSDQDLATENHQSFGTRAASFHHRLCRMGSGSEPRRDRAVHRDGNRSANRRDVRAKSVERPVRRARRVCRSERSANGAGPATAPNSSAATARSTGRWVLSKGRVLSNRVGAGLDPCGALQTQVRLSAIGTTEIVFFLGQAARKPRRKRLLAKYRGADLDAVFAEVTRQWDDTLGIVQVKTPDRALDILVNRWLPYQTLACRVWARTGFYQASGAYGFRDQLQDVMALCVARPEIAREHLLRAAGGNSPRATFSIGGWRNRIAAFARAFPTIAAGLAYVGCALCAGHGRYRGARRDDPVPGRPRAARRPARRFLPARRFPKSARACSIIARWRSTRAWRPALTACR